MATSRQRSTGPGAARLLGRPGPGRGAAGAAFVNAALIHALDFDDIHDAARLHLTAVTLPAALAAADLTGDHTLVQEAVGIGSEIMCRLGVAIEPDGSGPAAGWFRPSSSGTSVRRSPRVWPCAWTGTT